jgi:hypothetical protein
MPATYDSLATFTSNGSQNPISFQNIPQTYTDLVLIINGRATGTATEDSTLSYINSNTGTNNYSNTYFYTSGSSIISSRATNQVYFGFGTHPGGTATANMFGTEVFHFLNYSNSTTFKTVLAQSSADLNGSGSTWTTVNLWRQTAAINRIDMYVSGPFWASGSILSLYGIRAA